MDEVKTDGHRSLGGGVIGFGLLAWQPGNAVAFFLQLGEQHLLMAEAIRKQLLIQLTHRWFAVFKQLASFQLLPPSPDHWADREQRQLAWSDQAVGHSVFDALPTSRFVEAWGSPNRGILEVLTAIKLLLRCSFHSSC